MALHCTPGPWRLEGNGAGTIYGATRSSNQTAKPVADVVAQGVETEGNALLIAAAPDLYKALNALLLASATRDGPGLRRARASAVRALAKAEVEGAR